MLYHSRLAAISRPRLVRLIGRHPRLEPRHTPCVRGPTLLLTLWLGVAAPVRGAAQIDSPSPAPVHPTLAVPAIDDTALTLADVLTQVAAGHPLLAAAQARVQGALGAHRASSVLPNFVLSAQVENVRLPGGAEPDMARETMATATLPLEFLYQRGARVGQATAMLHSAEADALVARQRLALDAAHVYYRAALGQIEVATAQDIATWLDSLVAYNRTRAREGAAAEADLLRTELERDRAWAEVTMQEVELAHARADLDALLGAHTPTAGDTASPGQSVAIPDAPLPLSLAEGAGASQPPLAVDHTMVTDSLASRLADRPDVRAARARDTAASAGVSAARSLVVRELGLVGGLKWSGGTTSLVAGLSLPLPLMNQNGGEIAQAHAEREAAAAELAAVERTAQADLAGAAEGARLLTARTAALTWSGADTTAVTVTGMVVYLARADEARRITLGAYQEGAVPLLQVLDAARAWGEARTTYYRTLYAQHEAVLALLVAQGRDLFSAVPTLTVEGRGSTTPTGDTSPTPSR
jgi:cobalt-zinc-cadmium efflux system outer membrane protein